MSLPRVAIVLVASTSLAACELSQEAATNSGFRTPNASGVITGGVDNDGQQVRRTIADASGNGFAFAGGVDDDGLAAYAGVIPDSTGGAPLTATATFAANYQLFQYTDISLSKTGIGEGFISGLASIQSGPITLTADLDEGTLTGSSGEGLLSVSGTFSGTDLSGDVTYRGVDGDLDGVIGEDRTVGAFHGNTADLIYAGGFIGTNSTPDE